MPTRRRGAEGRADSH